MMFHRCANRRAPFGFGRCARCRIHEPRSFSCPMREAMPPVFIGRGPDFSLCQSMSSPFNFPGEAFASGRWRTPTLPAWWRISVRSLAGSPGGRSPSSVTARSEEHTSELQSRLHLVCRLLLEKNNPASNALNPEHLQLRRADRETLTEALEKLPVEFFY